MFLKGKTSSSTTTNVRCIGLAKYCMADQSYSFREKQNKNFAGRKKIASKLVNILRNCANYIQCAKLKKIFAKDEI